MNVLKQNHRHKKQPAGCQVGGVGWEAGVGRLQLLYLEWTNNKVLMYSTGNYSHYPVIM